MLFLILVSLWSVLPIIASDLEHGFTDQGAILRTYFNSSAKDTTSLSLSRRGGACDAGYKVCPGSSTFLAVCCPVAKNCCPNDILFCVTPGGTCCTGSKGGSCGPSYKCCSDGSCAALDGGSCCDSGGACPKGTICYSTYLCTDVAGPPIASSTSTSTIESSSPTETVGETIPSTVGSTPILLPSPSVVTNSEATLDSTSISSSATSSIPFTPTTSTETSAATSSSAIPSPSKTPNSGTQQRISYALVLCVSTIVVSFVGL